MVIRENEIYKRITSVVKTALEQLGITGFQVMQVSQPIATSDHACVLISRIDIRRYGWQGFSYDRVSGSHPEYWKRIADGVEYDAPEGTDMTVRERWNYIDEATFQISSFLPRKVNATTETLTSYDAVSGLATWLMSPTGIAEMHAMGFQPLRISEIRVPVQQDDSNVPQFNPNFDMHFLIPQDSGIKQPMVQKVRVRKVMV